ncbi:hypothetical protein [Halobacillus salinus]|uniref:hypothetical protein n=1 Tax=Halobacillus salinus TaxID=192814 RepID=UPI00159002D1|nr:hypothetical protein [Halobacillus salinus]
MSAIQNQNRETVNANTMLQVYKEEMQGLMSENVVLKAQLKDARNEIQQMKGKEE